MKTPYFNRLSFADIQLQTLGTEHRLVGGLLGSMAFALSQKLGFNQDWIRDPYRLSCESPFNTFYLRKTVGMSPAMQAVALFDNGRALCCMAAKYPADISQEPYALSKERRSFRLNLYDIRRSHFCVFALRVSTAKSPNGTKRLHLDYDPGLTRHYLGSPKPVGHTSRGIDDVLKRMASLPASATDRVARYIVSSRSPFKPTCYLTCAR